MDRGRSTLGDWTPFPSVHARQLLSQSLESGHHQKTLRLTSDKYRPVRGAGTVKQTQRPYPPRYARQKCADVESSTFGEKSGLCVAWGRSNKHNVQIRCATPGKSVPTLTNLNRWQEVMTRAWCESGQTKNIRFHRSTPGNSVAVPIPIRHEITLNQHDKPHLVWGLCLSGTLVVLWILVVYKYVPASEIIAQSDYPPHLHDGFKYIDRQLLYSCVIP